LFGVDRSCLLFAAELVAVDCRLQRSWLRLIVLDCRLQRSWSRLIVDRSGVGRGEAERSGEVGRS